MSVHELLPGYLSKLWDKPTSKIAVHPIRAIHSLTFFFASLITWIRSIENKFIRKRRPLASCWFAASALSAVMLTLRPTPKAWSRPSRADGSISRLRPCLRLKVAHGLGSWALFFEAWTSPEAAAQADDFGCLELITYYFIQYTILLAYGGDSLILVDAGSQNSSTTKTEVLRSSFTQYHTTWRKKLMSDKIRSESAISGQGGFIQIANVGSK